MMKKVNIAGKFDVANDLPFTLIAGPCAMENRDLAMKVAEELKKITEKLGINYIFKSSADKANRTSIHSKRGIGFEKAMPVFEEIRKTFDIPTTTDIHESYQAEIVKNSIDIIQIPAFLCRQTDLLKAAAETGLPVNVKKGQMLSPWEMGNVVSKLEECGTDKIMLMERGTSFGYNRLVLDPITFPELKKFAYPVWFDSTHCVQLPGAQGTITGGMRPYIPNLAKAAIVQGIAGLFMEIHDCPQKAICDSTNQMPLDKAEEFLKQMQELDAMVKGQNPIVLEQ